MENINEHYARLLGLEPPWRVKEVDLALEESRVEIEVEFPPGESVPCPECGRACPLHDHREERGWPPCAKPRPRSAAMF